MHRPIRVSLTVALLAAAMTAGGSAQSPPPYPEDADVAFEPVGDSAWRVIEPDLDCEREPFQGARETAIAPDGRVWLFDPQLGIRELGACRLQVEGYVSDFIPRDQELAPDGTLWVLDADRLMSWGGSDWVIHAEGQFNVERCRRGDTPATREEVDAYGGSCSYGCEDQGCYFRLDVGPDGTVWLSGSRLASYDGVELREYQEDWMEGPLAALSPDGGVWVYGREGLYVFYP